MNLIALPAFFDHCIWKFHDGRQAVVVDPVDAAPVLLALATSHLTLAAILVTPHHADHVGDDGALRPRLHRLQRDRLRQPACRAASNQPAAVLAALRQ